MPQVSQDALHAALETVIDPEIRRPVTELGMVGDLTCDDDGRVAVTILLTVAGCPLKDTITQDITAALTKVDGVTDVTVTLGVMTDEQRADLKTMLRGGTAEREIPFAQPGSLTRVYAVASGKGGVGKSSVTANLAAALAEQGLAVGVVDADIYGFSIPRMLGVDAPAHPGRRHDHAAGQPRREGHLDRDVQSRATSRSSGAARCCTARSSSSSPTSSGATSTSCCSTCRPAPATSPSRSPSSSPAPRSSSSPPRSRPRPRSPSAPGPIAPQTHQRVAGVIENMSWLELPDGSREEIFGSGGGQDVADSLSKAIGADVPLLGQIPIDTRLRIGADQGMPRRPRRAGLPRRRSPARHRQGPRSTLARPRRALAGALARRPLTRLPRLAQVASTS